MSTNSAHLKLVRDQGAPKHEGYNPIAPRSHRWMMDASQPEEVRVAGWALWRTIDRDPEGQTGPPKKYRTSIAHDERVGKREWLRIEHLKEDLGMTLANATDAARRTAEKGLIQLGEQGQISPRGDAPLPRRIKSKDTGDGDDDIEPVFFCTENCPRSFYLIFQSLDIKQREQYTRLYRKMPERLSAHYESLAPEPRAFHTWKYLEACDFKEQVEADALAAARQSGREVVDRACEEAGYIDEETRGRKEVKRDLVVELNVLVKPGDFSVQKNEHDSVQNGNSFLYRAEDGTVQKTPSLLGFQWFQWIQSEVESTSVEKCPQEAPPPASPLTEKPFHGEEDEEPVDALFDPDPIVNSVQQQFGRKLAIKDALRANFIDLPAKFQIPRDSVLRFFGEKFEKKRSARYSINTPGALYEFTLKDLPGWIRQHRREIDSDAKWEQERARKNRVPANLEPSDAPDEFNTRVRELASTKGMS